MTLVSIAAGGVAKSLVAVTISLHPGAAQRPLTTSRFSGVTRSARSACTSTGPLAKWPALWWANRRQIPDPSMIGPGSG